MKFIIFCYVIQSNKLYLVNFHNQKTARACVNPRALSSHTKHTSTSFPSALSRGRQGRKRRESLRKRLEIRYVESVSNASQTRAQTINSRIFPVRLVCIHLLDSTQLSPPSSLRPATIDEVATNKQKQRNYPRMRIWDNKLFHAHADV